MLMVWWHDAAERPRAHHQYSAEICNCVQREFQTISDSYSRSVDSVWEDTKRYLAVRNHTDCVDLWKLYNSVWNQEFGKIECVFHMMKYSLYTPKSPKYIPSIAQSISVIPVFSYTTHSLHLDKLSGGGGENQIFPPQWHPCASLYSLNQCLQMLLTFDLGIICRQFDRIYCYK